MSGQLGFPTNICEKELAPGWVGAGANHRPYLRPNFFFSFCFLRTTSRFRSFHMLLRSLMGREPTYFPVEWRVPGQTWEVRLMLGVYHTLYPRTGLTHRSSPAWLAHSHWGP